MRYRQFLAMFSGAPCPPAPVQQPGIDVRVDDARVHAKPGERIPLSPTLKDAGGRRFSIDVSATVRAPGPEPGCPS